MNIFKKRRMWFRWRQGKLVLETRTKASYWRQELSVAYSGTEHTKKLSKLKHVIRLTEVKHVIRLSTLQYVSKLTKPHSQAHRAE